MLNTYTYSIVGAILSPDPTQLAIEAILTDGVNTIDKAYYLPIANNPQVADFQNLIQKEIDDLNMRVQQTNTLEQMLVSQIGITPK